MSLCPLRQGPGGAGTWVNECPKDTGFMASVGTLLPRNATARHIPRATAGDSPRGRAWYHRAGLGGRGHPSAPSKGHWVAPCPLHDAVPSCHRAASAGWWQWGRHGDGTLGGRRSQTPCTLPRAELGFTGWVGGILPRTPTPSPCPPSPLGPLPLGDREDEVGDTDTTPHLACLYLLLGLA